MNKVTYRDIEKIELKRQLFDGFERYQDVKKCWRKEFGKWVLKDIAFVDQWGEKEYAYLVECLQKTIEQGGSVMGAFLDGKLVGFVSVEATAFGSSKQYLQLSSLHVSYPMRGNGIGRELFTRACAHARRIGGKKLYISAHSAEETQAFYRAMGCVEAQEYDPRLSAAEPCDCQMEYCLQPE